MKIWLAHLSGRQSSSPKKGWQNVCSPGRLTWAGAAHPLCIPTLFTSPTPALLLVVLFFNILVLYSSFHSLRYSLFPANIYFIIANTCFLRSQSSASVQDAALHSQYNTPMIQCLVALKSWLGSLAALFSDRPPDYEYPQLRIPYKPRLKHNPCRDLTKQNY
jgi:hypothetical protein